MKFVWLSPKRTSRKLWLLVTGGREQGGISTKSKKDINNFVGFKKKINGIQSWNTGKSFTFEKSVSNVYLFVCRYRGVGKVIGTKIDGLRVPVVLSKGLSPLAISRKLPNYLRRGLSSLWALPVSILLANWKVQLLNIIDILSSIYHYLNFPCCVNWNNNATLSDECLIQTARLLTFLLIFHFFIKLKIPSPSMNF